MKTCKECQHKDKRISELEFQHKIMWEETRRNRIEILQLTSMCRAAAFEIKKHWKAHCDTEGYGPCNLHARLDGKISPDLYPGELSEEDLETYARLTGNISIKLVARRNRRKESTK